MADFDKNLQPIIKSSDISKSPDIRLRAAKEPSPMYNGNGERVSDLAQPVDIFQQLKNATQASNFETQGVYVSDATLQANKRYKTYNPTIDDQEDNAAYGQSAWEQAANGVLKGVGLAATTVAGGFATIYGVGKAATTGRLADIWDNEALRALDELNEKVDNEYLPNYQTNIQKNAAWYSTDNWMTTNWLFNGLIKNAGYAVGAMVGGNIANAVLLKAGSALGKLAASSAVAAEASQAFKLFTPLLRNTSRAFSNAKNIEASDILRSQISSIADLSKKSSLMFDISKQQMLIANFSDKARRTAVAAYSSGGEASFEALQTGKEYRNNLIEEYKKENFGQSPFGEELQEINRQSEKVGKVSFFGNLGLLAATEYIQLPYLIGSSYKGSRSAANTLLGETNQVILNEVGQFAAKAPTKFGKILAKAGVLKYGFDPKEGFQEVGQFALQVGTQNYFNKAYNEEGADLLVDGLMYGFFGVDDRGNEVGAINSKEGIESGIMGSITGGVMRASRTYKDGKAKTSNTQNFLNMLNDAPTFKEAFMDKMESIDRATTLHGQHRDAIVQGDKLEALDIEDDLIHNYLAPRIKYGRFDMFMADMNELKEKSMTVQGLAELKDSGLANINDTSEQYQARLQKMQTSAKNLSTLYESMNNRFSGMVDSKDPTKRMYSPEVIDKLAYAAAKISNYDIRIPEVNSNLLSAGINTFEILESLIEDSTTSTEATKLAINKINSMNVTSDVKDGLKGELSDVIELSLRRKMFLDEYEQIKSNPLNYERAILDDDSQVEVSQKDKTKKQLEVGKEYSLIEPLIEDDGRLIKSPKVNVVSKTLGGEFETKLPDGRITFLSEDSFDKYNISDVDNSSAEIETLINQAIDEVFDFIPNRSKSKPTGNKLEFVNNLNNPSLRKSILKRFKELSKNLMVKRESLRKAEEELKKNKEELTKQLKKANEKSGIIETPPPSNKDFEDLEEGRLKDESEFFISSTTESEDPRFNPTPSSKPHILRARKFLNDLKKYKNRKNVRAVVFSAAQEKKLGLTGLIAMSYGASQEEAATEEFKTKINDVNTGFVGMVFVELDPVTGTTTFVGHKPGEAVDLGKIVFQTMPTTATTYNDAAKTPRYRADQKEQFIENAEAWKRAREKLFASSNADMFEFIVSRGISITTKRDGLYEKSAIGDNHLASQDDITSKQGLIQVVKTGTVSHNGKSKKVGKGLVVLQNVDVLQILNNNKFGVKKATSIFNVMKALSEELIDAATNGKAMTLNTQYMAYLQNVMFMSGTSNSNSKFWVNLEDMTIFIGDKNYSIKDFVSFEKEIVAQLTETYHSVNDKSLTSAFNDNFYEYIWDGKSLTEKRWTNYQEYLLSSDGRSIDDIPLVTNVNKPSASVPNSFVAKYATLLNFELDAKKVVIPQAPIVPVPPAPPVPKAPIIPPTPPVPAKKVNKVGDPLDYSGAINVVALPGIGELEFKLSKNQDGITEVEISTSQNNLKLISDLPEVAFQNLKPLASIVNPALASETGRQAILLPVFQYIISGEVKKIEAKAVPPASGDKPFAPKKPRPDAGFREVGKSSNSNRITNLDIEAFKEWHKNNVPFMPYEILESIIESTGGIRAWGVFENGVAKFFRKGERGTEYHEIFEGIWKAFLSPEERLLLLEEFKNKSGNFTDRASGTKIGYNEATDTQAKERIADDFSDFRLGKLPARTLGEKIARFFKAIIDFFKNFVNKPSLKEELFNAINTGKFKNSKISVSVLTEAPEYRAIPGISETIANEFVQDMIAETAQFLFGDNKEFLYNTQSITGDQVYSNLVYQYTDSGQFDEIGEERFLLLFNRVREFYKSLGVKINLDEVVDVDINDSDATNRNYAPEPFATDWKKNARFAVKFAIATMVVRKYGANKEIQIVESPNIEGKQLLPFGKTFADLLRTISNSTSQNFMSKLFSKVKKDANYAGLFKRLGGNITDGSIPFDKFKKDDWRFYIQFFQTYTKQKPNSIVQYKNGDLLYSAENDNFSSVGTTINKWIESLKTLSSSKESIVKYNKVEKVYKINTESDKYPKSLPKKSADMIDFIQSIGISFSKDIYLKLSATERQGQNRSDRDQFSDAVSKIYTYLKDNNSIGSLSAKILNLNAPYQILARLYNSVVNPDESNIRMNVKGEMMQKYSEGNAISALENEFNSTDTLDELLVKIPQLNDIFSKNSLVLKKGGRFFKANGDRKTDIKVSIIQGTYDVQDDSGKTISELNIGERYSLEINQNLKGNYYMMVPADSSTEWMLNLGNEINFTEIGNSRGWSKVYEIFRGYLSDEIALALDFKERQDLKLVKSIAKELRIFKDILPEFMMTEIHSMIEGGSTQEEIEEYVIFNTPTFNIAVKETLQTDVADNLTVLLENAQVFPILVNEEVIGYSYPGLEISEESGIPTDTKIFNKYNLTKEQLEQVLLFAGTNYAIANIEIHKILLGDPYQFNTLNGKTDVIKRIKSFLSPRRSLFNTVEYNNFLNENYNSVDGEKLSKDDLFNHSFKDYTSTVSMNDVELFTEAFEEVNETDGFSMIMDNTFREVKLKNADWSDQAEAWYQWQMAYTRQKMASKKLYTYDNANIEKIDRELILTPEPVHSVEVLKPIVSGYKANQTNEKNISLILDKYSQMPLFYKSVEGTTLETLYLKMLSEKIGYVVYNSGRKVGVRESHTLYNAKGEFNTTPFSEKTIERVAWASYGIQVENLNRDVKYQTRGSQVTKLSSMDMFEDGYESIPGATDAYARNTKALTEYFENEYNNLLERLGIIDEGGIFSAPDKVTVAELLQSEILKRDPSENLKDSLQLKDGQFLLPLEASTEYRKIKDIIYSLVHKSLVASKMSGGPHVQVPVTMWEDVKKGRELARKVGDKYVKVTRVEYDAMSEEDKKTVRLTSNTLKFYSAEQPYMEVMLPYWFKVKFMVGPKAKFKNDSELLNYLNNTEDGKKILTGVGFRIPTQAMSSIDVFRVKGFLPQSMGSTVVVPSEITSKAGSDFDIDKLNTYLKSVRVTYDGSIELIKYTESKAKTIEYYNNVYTIELNQQISKIRSSDDFRIKIISMLNTLNKINVDEYTTEAIEAALEPLGLIDFYYQNEMLIEKIEDQAADQDMDSYEYMVDQKEILDAKLDKLVTKLENSERKESFSKKMYNSAIENEYYESLEKLLQLPGNFERLMAPIGNAGLDKVAKDIKELNGENEENIKNKLISRSFLSKMRHAFVIGKKWVGIAAVNITGHVLAQKAGLFIDSSFNENIPKYDREYLGDYLTILPHNKTIIDGEEMISLAGKRSADGKSFISDRLSGYATGFVDVANDPFIMSIVRSNLVVGTALFMERIGVGETTPYFLNQPIIVEYLKYLDSINSRSLFLDSYADEMFNKFPMMNEDKGFVPDVSIEKLRDNIKKYSASKFQSSEFNADQRYIFSEFLKLSKMAQYIFKFTQAYNYDTTRFKNSDSFARKSIRTESARKSNIISSIDNVLDDTFIGPQMNFINDALKAMGAIFKLESPEYSYITDELLREYREDEYLSQDDFEKVTDKAKASFLDFIIHTNLNINQDLERLTAGENSVANQLVNLQNRNPNLKLLNGLTVESSNRRNGAKTIKLEVKPENGIEINMYIEMMRELKILEPQFYNDLIKLAIIQGTYPSRVSINQIIPVEDYASLISPIIEGLRPSSELELFYKEALFQRNNWKDDLVVPRIESLFMKQIDEKYTNSGTADNSYDFSSFLAIPSISGVTKSSRQVMILNPKYNPTKDIIKLPRVIKRKIGGKFTGELIDVMSMKTISISEIMESRKKGYFTYDVMYGYKKVKYSNGDPVFTSNGYQVYKRVNLYGDGILASEYKFDGSNSIYDNGSSPLVLINKNINRGEIKDSEIIRYFGGEIISTSEQNFEKENLFTETQNNPQETIKEFKDFVDEQLNRKIKNKLQQLYPEIKLEYSNNPIWEQGDNVFNQEIQDDYFEGNQIKYSTEIEKISNLILNKLKFKLKNFNGKYDDTITSLLEYKDKVLNDLLQNIGIQGVNNLEQLKIKLNSTELQQELKTNLQEVKINKDQIKTELDNFYHVRRLLNNFLKHQDINKYDQEQQATIRQYLPSLFKENKFKSDKQAFAFLKRKINTPEWGNKIFNLDKITLSFLGNNAKIGKYETLINYFKIDKKDAIERIYNLVENELNRREKFFTSEKIQSKINAKIAEDRIKSDNDKAQRERIRNEELNKYKNSTVVQEVEGFLGARNIHDLEDVLNSANINVELAIIKNNNYSLDKTPKGKQSNLYKDILNLPEVNGDIEIAKKLKSLIYSDDFQNWFGDWINNSEESSKIVDENGEPKLVYHGSSREFSNFAKEQRGTTTGKWKDRMSDSEQSFMFTDSPTTAFYYAIIERQQIIGEILYYVRKSAQAPTTELIQEMYKKYPSIKNWVDALKEKELTKEEILKEFNRIYNEYSNIGDLKEGGAIGNQEANNSNTKKIIEYLRNNKTNLLKYGVKNNEKYNTAIIPNSKDGSYPIWLWSSREYRTSSILGTGILNSFDNKDLNGKNIKDLTSEEFDLLVNEFEKDFIYNYEKIQDEIKAGGFTPKIYPVFLNAKTINSKDFKGRPFIFQQGDSEEVVAKRESKGAAFEVADLIDEAIKNKLDGTIIENIADPTVSINYAVFESENIKSLFNKKDYTSLNNFYNQISNGKIIGQANIKALTVLIDAAYKNKPDLVPHEYAHHYIAWYRNSPIVQEAIKKWGSEEALVQSIGEQVVLQKGEALNWWNEFTKWILDKFNNLSKLQKQELTQILTDSFLTRQDLGNNTQFQKSTEQTSSERAEITPSELISNQLTSEQNKNIDDVESLRAEEQIELQQVFPNIKPVDGKIKKESLSAREDIAKFDEIYNKYDLLITPLLNKNNLTTEQFKNNAPKRIIKVNQYSVKVQDDGKMFFDNGDEVLNQTIKNKVNIRMELQDKTLRMSIYNKAEYFVLLDGRILGSGKTNLGKESITDPQIKEQILDKAVPYSKKC